MRVTGKVFHAGNSSSLRKSTPICDGRSKINLYVHCSMIYRDWRRIESQLKWNHEW